LPSRIISIPYFFYFFNFDISFICFYICYPFLNSRTTPMFYFKCTFCEHYVPPDTFRAAQFRDLAGLDFPFHFLSTLFFFCVMETRQQCVFVCTYTRSMCRWLAPLFTYARLLVAARSYARNAKLPFDVRVALICMHWKKLYLP